MEHDLEQASNMKLLLCAFENLSGLKINFYKIELFYFGEAKQMEGHYTNLYGCGLGQYPFRYLGIPMHHKKISNVDWKVIEEKFEKKLSCWKGKLLLYGGRLVLINSVLSSLSMFILSFFEVPKEVLHKLDFYRSRFFWQGDSHKNKKKYRLAKWGIICRPKDQGGLGVLNLEVQNKCLLSKWLFILVNSEEEWQQLIKNKYLGSKTLTQVTRKPGDSQFWSGLMNVKGDFFKMGMFNVHDGRQTRFCDDSWLGTTSLKQQYLNLYNILRRRNAMVAKIFISRPLNISFCRSFVAENLLAWHELVGRLMDIQLTDGSNSFKWSLNHNGQLSISSMYQAFLDTNVVRNNSHL
jgi:hypothetical protein